MRSSVILSSQYGCSKNCSEAIPRHMNIGILWRCELSCFPPHVSALTLNNFLAPWNETEKGKQNWVCDKYYINFNLYSSTRIFSFTHLDLTTSVSLEYFRTIWLAGSCYRLDFHRTFGLVSDDENRKKTFQFFTVLLFVKTSCRCEPVLVQCCTIWWVLKREWESFYQNEPVCLKWTISFICVASFSYFSKVLYVLTERNKDLKWSQYKCSSKFVVFMMLLNSWGSVTIEWEF